MIKIGLITDIHAEPESLLAALGQLEKKGITEILCAGDLIGKGPEGERAAKIICERQIPSIKGNHENNAPDDQKWLHRHIQRNNPDAKKFLLSEDTLAYLGSLPDTLEKTYEGKKVFIAHGTPWSDKQYVYQHSPKFLHRKILEATQADVVVLGHTHLPMLVKVRPHNKLIVNPGSICGVFSSGTSSFGVLTLPGLQFEIFDAFHGIPVSL